MRKTDFNLAKAPSKEILNEGWTRKSTASKTITYRGARLEACMNTETGEYQFYINNKLLIEDCINSAQEYCDFLFDCFKTITDLIADCTWIDKKAFGEWTESHEEDFIDLTRKCTAHGFSILLSRYSEDEDYSALIDMGPIVLHKHCKDGHEAIYEAERMADVIINFMEEIHDNGFLLANWNVFDRFSKKAHKQFLKGILSQMKHEEPDIYKTLMMLGDEKTAIKYLWAGTDLLLLNMSDTPYCDCIDFIEDLMGYLSTTLKEREAEYMNSDEEEEGEE